MNWKINIAALLLLLVMGCNSNAELTEIDLDTDQVLTVEELQLISGVQDIKLVDFRKEEQYNGAHIPGAINLWRSDIEDAAKPGSGLMAGKQQMQKLLEEHGIAPTDLLVIYDDNAACDAARFWWIMHYYGHRQLYLLDGGLTAWKQAQGPLSNEIPELIPSKYPIDAQAVSSDLYISQKELIAALKTDVVLIDARTADEYTGKQQKKGAMRAGRIPGSINIDWVHAVNYQTDKHFKTQEELQGIFSQFGIEKDKPIIVYCHSGVRSAHMTFVLTQLLGYENVRNYDGSWLEWSANEELAIASEY